MGIKYGGKTITDYSAMRGPCPSGYHIPSEDEWVAMATIGMNIGAWTRGFSDGGIDILLHIPRYYYLHEQIGQPYTYVSSIFLWTYTPFTEKSATVIGGIGAAYIDSLAGLSRAGGCPIRAFKDVPVVPDSNWTTIYQGSGDAGVFWNTTEGLISITDGDDIYTIMDKNLGATTVWSSGDSVVESNYGYGYQWGNNYGFSFFNTNSTTSTLVDPTGYGPGNYYNNSNFVTVSSAGESWCSSRNDNLWGYTTGVKQLPVDIVKKYYGGITKSDYSAMRGPCNDGFHIPSKSEFQVVTNAGIAISAWGDGTLGTNMLSYLKIPLAGYHSVNITSSGTAYRDIQVGLYCCTCTGTYYADVLKFGGATSTYNDAWNYPTSTGRGFGYFIRPFKDTPIIPDSDWTVLYDGSSVSSGAGIFHNADLGLISISEDGINWTTIADKNLGATIVYNNGDTMSEANCGGRFQWGNNYMFPFDASFTYSTDKIDATGYGPGNYYNSSTYIGASQRDTSNNKNLRGGETGVQGIPVGIKKVYMGKTDGTFIQIRPYIPDPDPCTFCCTGSEQCYTVPKNGIYKLQLRGAQGGTCCNPPGLGGYSEGCICLLEDTVLYVYVGGEGTFSTTSNAINPGGYNGGGAGSNCGTTYIGPSGGGGTDIRIGGNTLYHRRIVAGGGGGGGRRSTTATMCGGAGGGECGIAGGRYSTSRCGGTGGTQTAGGTNDKLCYMVAGSFGQGGYKTCGISCKNGSGGGGGWYGGGAGAGMSAGGGGGSGYIYNATTCGSAPEGYCHCSDYYLINACTVAGDTSFPDINGGTETGHCGNGNVIISFIC